jgi:transaldolase
MSADYFERLARETPTRLWINNPTMPEADLAIRHGAVACTSNPTYGANLLRRDRDYALGIVDEAVRQTESDSMAADLVQQRLVARVMERFLPVYEKTDGALGYVSIQGNPYADPCAAHIVQEARRYRALGPNFVAKIPVIDAGIEAIGILLRENVPVIATEIFSIAQMIAICETYREAAAASGHRPPFFVTHITGIFDAYLQKEVVDPLQLALAPGILRQAGLAVARKQYRIFKDRGYDGIMLGGGARDTHHFTGLVGGDMHITINWSTAEAIMASDAVPENTLARDVAPEVVEELCEKLPDFRLAWEEDLLQVEAFKDFGPVQRFRRLFINGWDAMLADVAQRRADLS